MSAVVPPTKDDPLTLIAVSALACILRWLGLRNGKRFRPVTRYFLTLAMAGNLFTGTGYFCFSGVFDFGDWAAVIQDLHPHWLWRLGLVGVGVASYYASILMVAAELNPFRSTPENPRRLRAVCWTPYFTDGILAGLAGLLNPAGLFYVVASALPSTLGANAGLLSLPSMMGGSKSEQEPVAPIARSSGWVATGAIASLLFILVLGRGVTWSR
jgi:hypothetical protein